MGEVSPEGCLQEASLKEVSFNKRSFKCVKALLIGSCRRVEMLRVFSVK